MRGSADPLWAAACSTSQRDVHAGKTERNLETGLSSRQLKNDAVAVLKRSHLAAADESAAGASPSKRARDGRGACQVAGSAPEVHRRDPEAADADAADRQGIVMP